MEKIFKNFIKRFFIIRKALGIDIQVQQDGGIFINMAVMELRNGKAVLLKGLEQLRSLDRLNNTIIAHCPTVINIGGYDIFLKKTKIPLEHNPIAFFFPSVNPKDFFYYTEPLTDGCAYFMARKEPILKIIQKIQHWAGDSFILQVTLGSGGLRNILPHMDSGHINLKLTALHFKIQDKQIEEILSENVGSSVNTDLYRVSNDCYKGNLLIAIGSCLDLIGRDLRTIAQTIEIPESSETKINFINYKRYRLLFFTLISATALFLLVNTTLFFHYYTANAKLVPAIDSLQASKLASSQLKTGLDAIYLDMLKNKWNIPSRYSYFADRIAAQVPPSICLDEMNFAPLQDNNFDENLSFNNGIALISGTSVRPDELSSFLAALKNIPAIKNISLTNYSYRKELKASMFSLEIHY